MSFVKFLNDNLFSIFSVLAVAGWMFFLLVMDQRHEAKGTAAEETRALEMSNIRRELREKKAYEMTDPGSKYSQARQMIIDELEDELKELEGEK